MKSVCTEMAVHCSAVVVPLDVDKRFHLELRLE